MEAIYRNVPQGSKVRITFADNVIEHILRLERPTISSLSRIAFRREAV